MKRTQKVFIRNYRRRRGLKGTPKGSRRVLLNPGKFENRLLGPTIIFNNLAKANKTNRNKRGNKKEHPAFYLRRFLNLAGISHEQCSNRVLSLPLVRSDCLRVNAHRNSW